MTDPVDALVLDLLEWLGAQGRRYDDTMAAWRTSCPRLPVWEEAQRRGHVEQGRNPAGAAWVALTADGAAHLQAARPRRASG